MDMDESGRIIAIAASLIGRNLFQVRYIRWSYRMRGNVARIQMKSVATNIVLTISLVSANNMGDEIPVKNTIDRSLIIRMLAYSAIKISANIPLLYSTLNPETSSDSPSAKSNGVRFVSARFVINHIIASGSTIIETQEIELIEIVVMSICLWRIRALSKIRDILTS